MMLENHKMQAISKKLKRVCCFSLLLIYVMTVSAEELAVVPTTINEPRTITLQGTIDPRLYAVAKTIYIPSDTKYKEACLSQQKNWATGHHKIKPAFAFVEITPDENNRYQVTLPIDYVGESACGYRYYATDITIRRDAKDALYARFTVLGGRERHIRKGTATGSSGVRGLPVMPDNKRRYFRLPNDTKIRCFTKYFQWRDGSSFICYEQYDGESGLDELTRIKTNIDISIDESRNTYIPDDGSGKQSYHFRDY